jgi:hypothetical protein
MPGLPAFDASQADAQDIARNAAARVLISRKWINENCIARSKILTKRSKTLGLQVKLGEIAGGS